MNLLFIVAYVHAVGNTDYFHSFIYSFIHFNRCNFFINDCNERYPPTLELFLIPNFWGKFKIVIVDSFLVEKGLDKRKTSMQFSSN